MQWNRMIEFILLIWSSVLRLYQVQIYLIIIKVLSNKSQSFFIILWGNMDHSGLSFRDFYNFCKEEGQSNSKINGTKSESLFRIFDNVINKFNLKCSY